MHKEGEKISYIVYRVKDKYTITVFTASQPRPTVCFNFICTLLTVQSAALQTKLWGGRPPVC